MPRLLTLTLIAALCLTCLTAGWYAGYQSGFAEGRASTGVYNKLPDTGGENWVAKR